MLCPASDFLDTSFWEWVRPERADLALVLKCPGTPSLPKTPPSGKLISSWR